MTHAGCHRAPQTEQQGPCSLSGLTAFCSPCSAARITGSTRQLGGPCSTQLLRQAPSCSGRAPPFVLLLSCNSCQSPAALGGSLCWCVCVCSSNPAAVQWAQRVPVPAAIGRGSCSLPTHTGSHRGKRRQASRAERNLLQAFKEAAQALSSWLQAILLRAAVPTILQTAGEHGGVVSTDGL